MTVAEAPTALLGAAVIVALLVIRTAVHELREPGSARREWACLRDRRAVVLGTATVLVLGAVGWTFTGPAADELLPLRIAGGPLLVLAAAALMMSASFADRRDKQS
ncbi:MULTISPECIES: hypothetical protein [Streptomyces]|uniref:Uncharacterized protein n=1 Tax=Streptomyces venezuelae TaxID=54571 RepID=A0A5P2AJV1_STRVZ|nr:hypothetical protein [Streptomyces venezuelae]QES18443.1 hypothetical protein DEJ46_04480 [Streptomyces venezuelae]